jgi:hypothetical protein
MGPKNKAINDIFFPAVSDQEGLDGWAFVSGS